MLTLKGRTMIITGGAGNNGMKIVEMALENGMNVSLMSGFHAKAQSAIDAKTAATMVKKIKSDEFTLQDFLDQLRQVKKLGSLNDLLGMVPGMGAIKRKLTGVDLDLDGKEVKHMEAIILSMTPKERADTSIIDAKRRKRIALGSGTKVADVNKLLKQFDEMRKMMRRFKTTQTQQQQASKKVKGKKGKIKKGKNTKPKMPTLPNLGGILGQLGGKFPFIK